jgi:hypothetical protein
MNKYIIKTIIYESLNDVLRKFIVIRFKPINPTMIFIGNEYSGYWFPETLVNEKGCIYGVGLGIDSSFEYELVQHGYAFYGFEPEQMSYLRSIEQFKNTNSRVFNYGLSNKNGNFISRGSNFSIAKTYDYKAANDQIFEIKSLWNVVETLELEAESHPRVLKMNIEGEEREILTNFISHPLSFEILIFQAEFLFHLKFFQFSRRFSAFRDLWRIIREFDKLGWKVVHISKNQITIAHKNLFSP